jgi:hypothetical protein
MRKFSKCIKNNDVMKRTKDQVMPTVNMEGKPITSKAVLIMGKLKEFQGCIPCEIHRTTIPVLVYCRMAQYEWHQFDAASVSPGTDLSCKARKVHFVRSEVQQHMTVLDWRVL